jgi:hypothetical protein
MTLAARKRMLSVGRASLFNALAHGFALNAPSYGEGKDRIARAFAFATAPKYLRQMLRIDVTIR